MAVTCILVLQLHVSVTLRQPGDVVVPPSTATIDSQHSQNSKYNGGLRSLSTLSTMTAPESSEVAVIVAEESSTETLAPLPTEFEGVHARAFESWQYGDLPCFEPGRHWKSVSTMRSPSRRGFLYVKEMKTGGSTAAGVHLRIARNVAERYHPEIQQGMCKTRNDHSRAYHLGYVNREKSKSFLWTMLRDPTKRAISQFFHFEVSRNKVEPTDRNFRHWIEREAVDILDQYYIQTLILEEPEEETYYTQPAMLANRIMKDYDFIGITERFDESVVAMQLLLNLTTGDVLYTNSKSSGGFDDGMSNNGCTYIVPSFVSPGMEQYFKRSGKWRNMTYADTLLYQAANRSLDLTIDRLGRDRFDRELMKFRQAMKYVEELCVPKARFPCSSAGHPTDEFHCHWFDSGCGMSCLDDVANDLNLYEHDAPFQEEKNYETYHATTTAAAALESSR
eukprot:Nitzschia sp. Nitz4//scaffold37_size175936//40140//41486//NITZ4_002033-RA/size175936-processed-gene-0.178-mRNA-1//1//CDS//3329549749//1008//frame0